MTHFQEIMGLLGAITVMVSLAVYLTAIMRGKVHSSRVTWFVWIFVTGAIFFFYYKQNGWVSSIWVSLAYFIITILVFVFLLIFGQKGTWSWAEKFALTATVLIGVFWLIFHSALASLTTIMIVDIIGSIPLVRFVYMEPKAEYPLAWFIAVVGNILNLFAVEHWDFGNASYPIYMVILTGSVFLLSQFPGFLRAHKQEVQTM